jgi:hypothetical protein
MPPLRGWGGGGFGLRVLGASLFNSKFKSEINGNFNGSGRERPLHTLSVGGRVGGRESRFLALLGMTT